MAGLGEQASPVDLSGSTHRLWNRDPGGAWGPGQDPLYCGIPVLVGLHPDGDVLVFHENPADATVRIDAARPPLGGSPGLRVTFAGGPLRHLVVAGPLPRLLERLTEVTGRSPLPPRWALGYHQCRWGYKTAGDIREVAEGFAAERLPLSAVHLDIDYMDRYRVFSVDRERFPDLAGLSAELGRRGTRVVTILDPGVATDPDHPVYAEGLAGGHFVTRSDGTVATGVVWPGRVAFPDFTDPATRTWWAGHYRALVDQGVAGIWHDMNEPTSITLWGDHTIPRLAPMHGEGDGTDHRLGHNVYGLLMNEAGFEGLRAARPDRRPFILSRSGWAGLQRTAWNWTGDVESTWEGLRQQVATAIGLGLSGVPFTGSDIGGFSGTPSPELYLRWLELSVLMPFCRTHSVLGAPPREPWRFEAPVRQAIGRLIRLRYRLLPYLYTLAWQSSRTGHPLVRPLWWPPPDAPDIDGADRPWCDDAYLLGDDLLVAPVSEPGAVRRSLPLPRGNWQRWRLAPAMADPRPVAEPGGWTEGGRTVAVDTPAGQPVVFARAGSIVPLDDAWTEVDGPVLSADHAPGRLGLHCFPDGLAASGVHFDDAGDGDGPHRVDRFTFERRNRRQGVRRAALVWATEGEHPRPADVRVVLYGMTVTRAVVDGREVEVTLSDGQGEDGGPVSRIECPSFDELRVDLAD